jgi:hypothetical protein
MVVCNIISRSCSTGISSRDTSSGSISRIVGLVIAGVVAVVVV